MKVILDKQEFHSIIAKHAQRIIVDVIDDLKRLIIQSFGRQKHGKFYRKPKVAGGGFYQASAPGEAPAIRSGNLFRSLKERFPTPLSGELLIDTPYAAFLEDGTSAMAARPFVRPAIESVKARFASGALGRFG